MIHGFNINVSGTVFTAVSTNSIDRTNKELAQEQIPNIDKSSKTQKSEQISYETTSQLENSTLVAFKDSTNDKYVILSLKDSTLDKLKSHFSKDDFYKRDDGIVRLDNKAENYVSGWFGDIAYKREFLKADSDGDGKLNSREYNNTKNSFHVSGIIEGHGNKIDKITSNVDGVYINPKSEDKIMINKFENVSSINIDKQLDVTLNTDKDFNSKIDLKEKFEDRYKKNLTDSVIEFINEKVGLKGSKKRPDSLDVNLNIKLLKREMKESQEQLEALQKLKIGSGDIETLNKEDMKALDGLLPKDTKNISNDEINQISKNIINNNKIKEAYIDTEHNESEIFDLKS